MKVLALVLAAGKSTRIVPRSAGEPKPLLHFGGRRLIEWNLEWLAAAGVSDVWINLHYRADAFRSALGDGSRYGLRIRWSYEEEILGTAGAWREVARDGSGTSLVLYGDNVMRFDLGRFLAGHRAAHAVATVALFDPTIHAHTAVAGGMVDVDRDGWITAFHEGAVREGALVNAGAYLLEGAVLQHVGEGFQDFGHDVFPELIRERRARGHVLEPGSFCLGLDTPERFARAEALLETNAIELT